MYVSVEPYGKNGPVKWNMSQRVQVVMSVDYAGTAVALVGLSIMKLGSNAII